MSKFTHKLRQSQSDWLKTHIAIKAACGGRNRPSDAWILAPAAWEEGLWRGLRTGQPGALQAYLDEHKIHRHDQSHNLCSSWTLCANLYFPFRAMAAGRALLAGFLAKHVAADVKSVDGVELEFAAKEEHLKPRTLLGEAGGSRGKGQTSPDVAFIVNGGRGVVLTECKLGENSFYECSARTTKGKKGRAPNPDPVRCMNVARVLDDPHGQCHQFAWGRKYFNQLRPAIDQAVWRGLPCCPAAKGGYQLFRQQALAEALAASGHYDLVASCVAYDAGNDTLIQSLQDIGIDHFATGWGRLFSGRARFATWTHQEWVAWVRTHDHSGEWLDWLGYIEARYGYVELAG